MVRKVTVPAPLYLISLLFLVFCSGTSESFEYKIKHGLNILIDHINDPEKELVEEWTDEFIIFWKGYWPLCLEKSINETIVEFSDELIFEFDNRTAFEYAYPWSKYIVVDLGPEGVEDVVHSLFMHELVHVSIYVYANIVSEDESHEFMVGKVFPYAKEPECMSMQQI